MNPEAERRAKLQKEWEKNLPCWGCHLKEMCKYAFTIKRVDYASYVFGVNIVCKIKDNYKVVKP